MYCIYNISQSRNTNSYTDDGKICSSSSNSSGGGGGGGTGGTGGAGGWRNGIINRIQQQVEPEKKVAFLQMTFKN